MAVENREFLSSSRNTYGGHVIRDVTGLLKMISKMGEG